MNSLLRLLQLCDPALPIGGFSHSYGLETYVQKGIVKHRLSAHEFIVQMLARNIRYTDASFVSLAYECVKNGDHSRLQGLDQECSAVKLPKEIRAASIKLGVRLMKVFEALDENALVRKINSTFSLDFNYPVVYGMLAALMNVEKREALTGFYYNAAAGMVTNCVKLVPLGQQDGQQILFSLHTLITDLVEASMSPDPELVGLCCPAFDVRSMQHERLYSRLYMS